MAEKDCTDLCISKPTEFQLLAFPNDEPLTYAEREERKVLSSTVIS